MPAPKAAPAIPPLFATLPSAPIVGILPRALFAMELVVSDEMPEELTFCTAFPASFFPTFAAVSSVPYTTVLL